MAKSSVPADYREFVRVSVDLPTSPKLAALNDPTAGWAYICALCYCGQHLTDGVFPTETVLRLAGVRRPVARKLISIGMWHETGHECDRCPQPLRGQTVVHDYLEHQRSAQEARDLRDARREAGRRGAARRWADKSDSKSHSKSHATGHSSSDGPAMATAIASATPSAMANGWQDDGKPMAEVEVEEEEKKQRTTSSAPSAPRSGTRRKPMTPIPPDWAPTQAHRDYATEHALDLRFEAEQFRGHALSTDRRLADWGQGFRNWMAKSVERRDARGGRGQLRLASGAPRQYQPYRNPDQSEYDEPPPWETP